MTTKTINIRTETCIGGTVRVLTRICILTEKIQFFGQYFCIICTCQIDFSITFLMLQFIQPNNLLEESLDDAEG